MIMLIPTRKKFGLFISKKLFGLRLAYDNAAPNLLRVW
jgi:hypothetical protein